MKLPLVAVDEAATAAVKEKSRKGQVSSRKSKVLSKRDLFDGGKVASQLSARKNTASDAAAGTPDAASPRASQAKPGRKSMKERMAMFDQANK